MWHLYHAAAAKYAVEAEIFQHLQRVIMSQLQDATQLTVVE